ncbi:hypothetical protein MJD09_10065, partial [bacterium]|nr:hypothetical protein [bacterium]
HRLHFHECNLPDRLQILQKYTSSGSKARFWNILSLRRENLLFHNHIIRPILRLYSRTDAWVRAGYDNWPGNARGLQRYQTQEGP